MEKNHSFSNYVKDFYNHLDKKNYKSYSDWKWFKSKSSKSQFIQTKTAIQKALAGKKFNQGFEVGPGDGIWTELFLNYCNQIDAVDISEEMLSMAKKRLLGKNVIFTNKNFMDLTSKKKYDILYSIRCIEYFNDKGKCVEKMSDFLKEQGNLLIVTKNPYFLRFKKIDSVLHSKQIWMGNLQKILEENNFKIIHIFPAVFGKGFHFFPFRILSNLMQKKFLKKTNINNFFIKYFTESFLIYAEKNENIKSKI